MYVVDISTKGRNEVERQQIYPYDSAVTDPRYGTNLTSALVLKLRPRQHRFFLFGQKLMTKSSVPGI